MYNQIISNKEALAEKISQLLFSFDQQTIDGFFRRTLGNMKQFYSTFCY